MSTHMNISRFIALSAILAVMGLASSGAVASGKNALPVSDPSSKDWQLAARTSGDVHFKSIPVREGEVAFSNPGQPGDIVFRNCRWVSVLSKENLQANPTPTAGKPCPPAKFKKSIPVREGEIAFSNPGQRGDIIYTNGRWVTSY